MTPGSHGADPNPQESAEKARCVKRPAASLGSSSHLICRSATASPGIRFSAEVGGRFRPRGRGYVLHERLAMLQPADAMRGGTGLPRDGAYAAGGPNDAQR